MYRLHFIDGKLKVRIIRVQLQNGAVDCGLFAIVRSVLIGFKRNPLISLDQNKLREYVFKSISDGDFNVNKIPFLVNPPKLVMSEQTLYLD